MEPVLATLWPSAPPRFPPQQRLLHRPDNCLIKDQMMSKMALLLLLMMMMSKIALLLLMMMMITCQALASLHCPLTE